MQGSFDAVLLSTQNAASYVLPVTFPFKSVSHVLFSFYPHSLRSPPNFHCQSPPTHALTRSHTPRTFEPCRHLLPARYRLWRKIRLTSSKKAVKFMSRTLCFRRPFLRQGLLVPVCCPFPNKTIWSLSLCLWDTSPPPAIFPC